MNLLEYEAKSILRKYGIPIPSGSLLSTPDDPLETPAVLKSQVPTGGRGKLGGIKIIEHPSDSTSATVKDLFQKEIKGFKPSKLLAEEKLLVKKEFYLSLVINRQLESIELIAHTQGGIDVEENKSNTFLEIQLNSQINNTYGEQLAEYFGLESHSFALQDLAVNLQRAFIENDATLIEINPLILTDDDRLIAGDAKITLDDTASFRHPEWDFEYNSTSANFVTLNQQGTIATVANGAGLAMATVDAVASAGLTPANFLDIGGGANTESVLVAFRKIQEYPNLQAIVINIFAGITRCDEVARAIINAKLETSNLPPLFIRLAGTNYQAAETLLQEQNIPLLPTLESAIDGILEINK